MTVEIFQNMNILERVQRLLVLCLILKDNKHTMLVNISISGDVGMTIGRSDI